MSFSARFFDAYIHALLNNDLRFYLLLLGSASYYLCDLPGSSYLLVSEVGRNSPDLGGLGLDILLHWVLIGDFSTEFDIPESPFRESIFRVADLLGKYYSGVLGEHEIIHSIDNLHQLVYDRGSARQLLFADIVCAVIRKRIENSTRFSLPRYTGIPIDKWEPILNNPRLSRSYGLVNIY